MTFAEKLKALRKRKSLTQKELADISGISCSSIINYENSRRTDPPMSVLFGLANALGVSADAFRTNPQAIAETEENSMKLYAVGVELPKGAATEWPRIRRAFLRRICEIRHPGPGYLTNEENGWLHAVFVASDGVSLEELKGSVKSRLEGVAPLIFNVDGVEVRDNPDALRRLAEGLGVDIDALEELAAACRSEPAVISPEKPGKSFITIEMRVDGVEDAINKLKVLEAQLHGAKMMVDKISAAIDGLQMQLDNKIKSFERPDR